MQCNPKERGQGLVEYAIIAALVSLAALMALNLMGGSTRDAFQKVLQMFTGGNASGSQILFSDSFENGLGNWDTLINKFWTGKWDTQDGESIGSPLSAMFRNDFSGENYLVSVNSAEMLQKRSTWNGFGVFFRASNINQLDGYIFEVERVNKSQTGQMMFRKWENGVQIETPLASIPIPADFDWNNPGDIQIKVEGSEFTATINGQQVLKAVDTSFSSGTVGLASNYGTQLSVDGIQVETLP